MLVHINPKSFSFVRNSLLYVTVLGLNFSRTFYSAPFLPEAVCAHVFFFSFLKTTGKPANNSRLSPSGASFQLKATWKASTGTSVAFPVLGFPDSLPAWTRQYSSVAQKEKEGSSRQRSWTSCALAGTIRWPRLSSPQKVSKFHFHLLKWVKMLNWSIVELWIRYPFSVIVLLWAEPSLPRALAGWNEGKTPKIGLALYKTIIFL